MRELVDLNPFAMYLKQVRSCVEDEAGSRCYFEGVKRILNVCLHFAEVTVGVYLDRRFFASLVNSLIFQSRIQTRRHY